MSIVPEIDRVVHRREWMHGERRKIQRWIDSFLKRLKSVQQKGKIKFQGRFYNLLRKDLWKENIEELCIVDRDWIKHLLDRYHHRFVWWH